VANENDTPENDKDQDAMAAEWEAAMSDQAGGGGKSDDDEDLKAMDELQDQGKARGGADRVPLDELTEEEEPNTNPDLDVILDIPVSIAMEVGRTSITIRNLLQLNQGSVIELDRLAGEPLDVLVNGTLIAHGEVVVVNEKFGIRMTDVISPSERIKKLR